MPTSWTHTTSSAPSILVFSRLIAARTGRVGNRLTNKRKSNWLEAWLDFLPAISLHHAQEPRLCASEHRRLTSYRPLQRIFRAGPGPLFPPRRSLFLQRSVG